MIPTGPATKVYLALGTTDLRKGFEGLSDLVRHQMKEEPMSGHLFAFTNRNRSRIKRIRLGKGVYRRRRLALEFGDEFST